jgi:tRNA(Ile)-lysidine synthetase-like protein
MNIDLPRGRYVLAISGGVDSMTLLDLLVKQADSSQLIANSSTSSLELVVAHFDHGIRQDSSKDKELVAKAAKSHGLVFESHQGKLGTDASEDLARVARYKFLESVAEKHKAKGIITAHHQDDLIETAFINIIRGTGRAGLSSMSKSRIYRPLLSISKKDILDYAKKNHIVWHEDATNTDTKYLRNYIRTNITSRLTDKQKLEIINNLDKVAKTNKMIDDEIATLSHLHLNNQLDRRAYTMLTVNVAEELLMSWLRQNNLRDFDRKTIKRLSGAIKTGQAGSVHEIMSNRKLKLGIKTAILI